MSGFLALNRSKFAVFELKFCMCSYFTKGQLLYFWTFPQKGQEFLCNKSGILNCAGFVNYYQNIYWPSKGVFTGSLCLLLFFPLLWSYEALCTILGITPSNFVGFGPNFVWGCSLILCKGCINKNFLSALFSKFYLVKFKISTSQELKIFIKWS